MKRLGCPETSAMNYHSTLRKIKKIVQIQVGLLSATVSSTVLRQFYHKQKWAKPKNY